MASLLFRFARVTRNSGNPFFSGSPLLKASPYPITFKYALQFLIPVRACSTLVDHSSDQLHVLDNQPQDKATVKSSNELDIAHFNAKLQDFSDREEWQSVSVMAVFSNSRFSF